STRRLAGCKAWGVGRSGDARPLVLGYAEHGSSRGITRSLTESAHRAHAVYVENADDRGHTHPDSGYDGSRCRRCAGGAELSPPPTVSTSHATWAIAAPSRD